MRVDKEKLLQDLESVTPGLSPKEIVEQSSCFVFNKHGMLITFNDEIACQRKTKVQIEGAVSAAPLISLLQKLNVEEVELEVKDGELLVKAKNRQAGIRMEQEILLPIATVEPPKDWQALPDEFAEAVDIAQQCASDDESTFNICCVHIHPKFIEASDNFQLTRYKLKTGVKESVLVRQSSIKHIVSLGMTEFCETESWIHFRNKQSGLIFSCRRYLEEYPNLSEFLQVNGTIMGVPKGLVEAVDKAEIFSSENTDKNEVLVELRNGKLRLKGIGPLGWYSEVKKAKYNGKQFSFYIGPKLLKQLTERANECVIGDDKLKIDGGRCAYVVSLGVPNEDNEEEDVSEDEE